MNYGLSLSLFDKLLAQGLTRLLECYTMCRSPSTLCKNAVASRKGTGLKLNAFAQFFMSCLHMDNHGQQF